MNSLAGQSQGIACSGAVSQDAKMAEQAVKDVVSISVKMAAALADWIKGKPPRPLPREYPEEYRDQIADVYNALWSCGRYAPDTIARYTHVIAKLIAWCDQNCAGPFTHKKLNAFLAYYVHSSREPGFDRLGEKSDPYGIGVRYVAFYAIRAVLDQLCGMNVTENLARPLRPSVTDATTFAVCHQLYDGVTHEREKLLLVLTNGVGLMPSQTASLPWNAFDAEFRNVTVRRGKNVCSVEIAPELSHVLAECRQRALEPAFVFQSTRRVDPAPICVRTLQNVLGRLVTRCGVEKRVTLTSLRKAGRIIPGSSPPRRTRHDVDTDRPPMPENTLPSDNQTVESRSAKANALTMIQLENALPEWISGPQQGKCHTASTDGKGQCAESAAATVQSPGNPPCGESGEFTIQTSERFRVYRLRACSKTRCILQVAWVPSAHHHRYAMPREDPSPTDSAYPRLNTLAYPRQRRLKPAA